MSHPLEAYLCENKNGVVTDEQAKDSISGLVNDPGLLQDVCIMFSGELNSDARCYAVGKVYDVEDERYGCIAILSEDVVNVIGEDFLQKTHEEINYILLCAYLEYSRFCREVETAYETWDGYLDFVVEKNFLPLFKNGIRARLIHPDPVEKAALSTIVFIVYQNYNAVYG